MVEKGDAAAPLLRKAGSTEIVIKKAHDLIRNTLRAKFQDNSDRVILINYLASECIFDVSQSVHICSATSAYVSFTNIIKCCFMYM